MDEEEGEQLDEIHAEVQGSHAQLGVINERTRNIEQQVERLAGSVDENEEDINDLQDDVKRNTTILTGVSGGIGMVTLWLSDKITRVL